MPEYYEPDPRLMSKVFPKALGETLIGTDEEKRARKSFVPDKRMAIILARIANHYRRVAAKLILLHEIDTRPRDASGRWTGGAGEVLSFEEVMETYPQAVRSWKEFHDWLMEHLGSLEGFTTKAAVRAEMLRENENRPQAPAMPETQQAQQGGKF